MRRPRGGSKADASAGAAVAMLRLAADGAMLVDQDGIVRFWNRAAERLLGFRSEEVIGRPCHEVMKGETVNRHRLCSPACPIGRRLACGRGVRNFTMQTRTKQGRLIRLNISSLPVPQGSKCARCSAAHLFRDVTRSQRGARHGVGQAQRSGEEAGAASWPLTAREREVLRRLADGERTRDIAEHLCISRATVRNHVQHLLQKLGAHSRLQALALVYRPARELLTEDGRRRTEK